MYYLFSLHWTSVFKVKWYMRICCFTLATVTELWRIYFILRHSSNAHLFLTRIRSPVINLYLLSKNWYATIKNYETASNLRYVIKLLTFFSVKVIQMPSTMCLLFYWNIWSKFCLFLFVCFLKSKMETFSSWLYIHLFGKGGGGVGGNFFLLMYDIHWESLGTCMFHHNTLSLLYFTGQLEKKW